MNEVEMQAKLQKYHQTHVLKAYDRADDVKKEAIRKQVEHIDFEQLNYLYALTKHKISYEDAVITPMPYVDCNRLSLEEKEKYISLGEQIIQSGKLAVVTMAGGQGTRLGHNGPKGTFDIGLPSHKSLFELLTDYLKEACEKYHTQIPWYIMTSNENYENTVDFFVKNHFFQYNKNDITFFVQGELPMLDEEGKVIINEEGIIKEAADGHGGVFRAMFVNHVLEDMKKRNIEWVFVGSVDNPLVKMADPLFIGFTAFHQYLIASKTVVKAYPEEKIGVFCKKNGKPYVIEYTEITKEMAEARDEHGEFVYGEGHVLLNLFHRQVLEKIKEINLPYHCAYKKANHVDEHGNILVAEKPNAYRFESFIFDAFSMIPEIGLLRGKREDDFAPVKNAEGNDSPKTARELYESYQKRIHS